MVIYWGGGGGVPWGRLHWVGINFCHPEVVKLQQQCHMQNAIFDLPPTGSILFFFWEWESAAGELEGKMKMTIQ